MPILILLLFTIPVFYIYGIVALIRDITRKSNDQTKRSDTFINELRNIAAASPKKTVKELLNEYEKDTSVVTAQEPTIVTSKKVAQEEPSDDYFNNWYKNNSINLILYLGAFLIVTSAAIFVGFQWETLTGMTKATFLTLFTLVFFGCGLWFHAIPKIRNAGATFLAIAAVLIPVVGSAWYTFVFKYTTISSGTVWLVTSLLALITYIFLATRLKNAFYAYATSIATFSFSLSLVSTYQLHARYYILASILASFVLLLLHSILAKTAKTIHTTFSAPSTISANILMPITLMYGLFIATKDNTLVSLEGTLSVLLASLFYLLSYVLEQKTWKLGLAQILFPFSIILWFVWKDFPQSALYYGLELCAFIYVGISYWLVTKKKAEESDSSLVIAVTISLLVIISAWTSQKPITLAVFTLVPAIFGVCVMQLKKSPYFSLISGLSVALFLFVCCTKVFILDAQIPYLGIIYTIVGLIAYVIAVEYKTTVDKRNVASILTTLFLSLGLLFTIGNEGYSLALLVVIAGIGFSTTFLFSRPGFTFLGVVFSLLATLQYMNIYHTPTLYLPLIFSFIAVFFFIVSTRVDKKYHQEFRIASLGISIIAPLLFVVDPKTVSLSTQKAQQFGLISAYITTALFGLDTAIYKTKGMGYATSALAMLTFLWQMQFVGATETLLYTVPLGIYFAVLGYTRQRVHDTQNRDMLTFIGLSLLVAPAALLSFGETPMKYSIFLGVCSICLLALGISYNNKMYKYFGIIGVIFAVLPQTYSYILALPRWLVVGVSGLLFLGVGMFLLLRRKDN